MRRLSTDRIDLFYLHRMDDGCALDESLRAVDDLVRQGKVLYPAVSNFAAWQAAKALGVASAAGLSPLVAMQPMYNLAKRQAEVEILPMAVSENIAVFPYSPLGGGLLSGKYRGAVRPDSGRIIDNPMYTTRYADDENFTVAEKFCQLADARGVHPAALAVAWVGSHPAVTAPLIGGRNLSQLSPSLSAVDIDMTAELRAEIASLSRTPPPATDRNEEASAHSYSAVLRK